ncbi:DUF6114 domain-containing protein [Streptomyces noursei]|uniref:DUF6114 domain-containing protein n=1 Tax=Streptomyces noursei TaxID=1971 RepID=UPI0019A757AB|nr:DUF6114 domain-containing protein [Streptomyces noursei]MCZ1014081.1 DUF6114 domain-containing protein [Streptomyces noursei]GGX54250.1 hypothetical protein GCM10010341_89240 [Streptomyces noursei]
MQLSPGRPPYAASLCVAVAGVELGSLPLADPGLLPMAGLSGAAAVLVALALVGCAGHLWVSPRQHVYSGGAAIALGLLSYPLANLGGFLLGMFLALIGGALAIAWQPTHDAPIPRTAAPSAPGRHGETEARSVR